jgi:SAM-dependent methyltransferase
MTPEALESWFANLRAVLETAYLSHTEPWRQSGMSGPEQRWITLRKPVADCIERSGSFLDIGCANGYLLECCLRWTAERGLTIDPYGLDISAELVALARQRLPQFADHFFVANAFTWVPSMPFDIVRTELCYVPGDYEGAYVRHLLAHYLKPSGWLLVANYMEEHPHPEHGLLPGNYPTTHILERLAEFGLQPAGYRDGYDPIHDRHVRVAILSGQAEIPVVAHPFPALGR